MRKTFLFALVIPLTCLAADEGSRGRESIDLPTSLEFAKKNSQTLRRALFDLGTDETLRLMAYRLFLPSISLNFVQSDSVLYDGPDSRLKKISIGLSQLVWDRGVRAGSLKLKEIDLRMKRRLIAFREEDLLIGVVNKYLEAIAAKTKARILEEALGLAREQAMIAGEEMRLGDLREIDFLDIACEEKDLELELASARRDEERILHDFGKLLGLERGELRRPEGDVDEDYRGSIESGDREKLLDLAMRNSAELEKLDRDLFDLAETRRRKESSWVPEVTARLELSVVGTDFPLDRPGFSIGLDFAFDTPVMPVSAGFKAGRSSPGERSVGTEGGTRVAENLEDLVSGEIARADLASAVSSREEAVNEIEFSISEDLAGLEHDRKSLSLLREKRFIMEKKKRVEEVRLEVGDITRLEYVETEIELAKTKIAILSAVTSLFGRETALRRRCGTSGFGTYPLPIIGRAGGIRP